MEIFDILKENIIIHENQGYALYFYKDGRTFEKVNGKVRDFESADITFDTNFRLASVSKQFIAFSIVNLINENKLSYETIIYDIYNELPLYFKKITIKHLLNHTSGIYDYEDMPHSEDIQIVDEDIISFLKTTETTYFEPGTKYRYSNTAYILLGLIVQKISNEKIEDYIKINIFDKAGMRESKVNIQGITEIKNRAYGHILNENNELIVKDQYWCSATIGDGGLYSSINDLKKWCKFLTESKNFIEMKNTNYVGEGEYNEYGLGIRNINFEGNEIIYHCGSTIGTNTLLLFSIDLNMCLLFLTNLNVIDTSILKDNLLKYLSSNK